MGDEPNGGNGRKELSPDELRQLREMLMSRKVAIRMWALVGIWIKWIGVVTAAVAAAEMLFHQLKDALR